MQVVPFRTHVQSVVPSGNTFEKSICKDWFFHM